METSETMLRRILGCYLLMFTISVAFGSDKACGPDQPEIINAGISPTGNIYSPGYTDKKNYPDFASCSYQINAPSGMYIRLKFNEMDVEASDSCQSDSLYIYDFDEKGTHVVKSILCGNNTPRDLVSRTHEMQLYFNSNVFNTKKGFSITYSTQFSSALCPSGMLECRNRKCVSRSVKCNGKDDCGDGTDEEKCGLPAGVSECGNPAINPLSGMDRIVGGQEVIPGSWPWMADLHENLIEPNGHICGGALINSQWVLSAAHCFGNSRQPEEWRVHFGNHDKYTMEPNEQVRFVERIVIYDDIPPEQFEENGAFDIINDVALIKLNAPVNINTYVRPVCLPSAGKELELLTTCYATGWGYTRGTGSADFLKQARHPIQPDINCQRLVANYFHPQTMICAGLMTPLNGVCHGDSGGPLVCKMDKKWYVFGVASYVTDSNLLEGLCGLKNQPSVFAKVSAKVSWITKMINKYT